METVLRGARQLGGIVDERDSVVARRWVWVPYTRLREVEFEMNRWCVRSRWRARHVWVTAGMGLALLSTVACGMTVRSEQSAPHGSEPAPFPETAERLRGEIQSELETYLSAQDSATRRALADGVDVPAAFKHGAVLDALNDPWHGLTRLERHAAAVGQIMMRTPHDLAALIQAVGGGRQGPARESVLIAQPLASDPAAHLAYMIEVLESAERLRAEAIDDLDQAERRFLFDRAQVIARGFLPQVSEFGGDAKVEAEEDLRFAHLVGKRLDMAALVDSAKRLAGLSDPRWLSKMHDVFERHSELTLELEWATGTILLRHEGPSGLIIIGGAGPNRYQMDGRVALLIDLGGDDVYVGTIGAASSEEDGNRVVIDLGGNDRYHAGPLGLATGRLAVGMVVDREGDDEYLLEHGSGGTGFAGVGILVDLSGNDRYRGTKLTQGAGVGGIGLLVDGGGDDVFTSSGYAIGFAGPLAEGVLVDASGNDRYECGAVFPSNYNAIEAPDSKPGDPDFQYDGFCLGVAAGKRILTRDPQWLRYGLAGGRGILLDLAGNDWYASDTFSQGAGYFFGVGVKVDLDGDDDHRAARYGHGAGAHYAVGLFIDAQGHDRYGSTGPVYNGGTGWDRSVTLAIDAGDGDDVYDLSRSDGLGQADHGSWSLFIEEAGQDRYRVPSGMGKARENSLGGFFDLAGEDHYESVSTRDPGDRGNGRTFVDGSGGLFVDR